MQWKGCHWASGSDTMPASPVLLLLISWTNEEYHLIWSCDRKALNQHPHPPSLQRLCKYYLLIKKVLPDTLVPTFRKLLVLGWSKLPLNSVIALYYANTGYCHICYVWNHLHWFFYSTNSQLSVPAQANHISAAHWACLSRINSRETTFTWYQTKSHGPNMTDAKGQGGHSASAATAKG